MFNSNDPKLPFYVLNDVDLDKKNQKILINLYQPLIGAVGVSLYLTFNNKLQKSPLKSDFSRFYQLQEQLDLDLQSIFTAIHQLEAVGLVKTFQVENEVLNTAIQFELIPVLDPADFFDTYLLSGLLLEKIGEVEFKKVKQAFKDQQKLIQPEGENVSASFFDVFHINDEKVINPPELVTQAAAEFSQSTNTGSENSNSKNLIDWEFLGMQLAAYNISENQLDEHRNEISEMIKFFDLTELDFVKAVTKTLNPGQQELDLKKIKQVLMNQPANQSHVNNSLAKKNDATEIIAALTDEDQENLAPMLKMTALKYLQALKQKKGGYVSNSEKSIIYQLHNVYRLSDELINALSFVVLKQSSILNKNLVDSIANDWLQHGITTAAAALVYVNQRSSKKTKQKSQFSTYKKIEVGTDWKAEKKDNQDRDQQNLDDLFKKLSD